MSDEPDRHTAQLLSVVSGPTLDTEPGLGTLTLPGFIREVTTAHRGREALVFGTVRWTYAELWQNAVDVARALRAWGVGKGTRVGILMTNRPEWLTAVSGTSLAGGVAVALSTFSTPDELDHLLEASVVSVLLFERTVLTKDFAEMLVGLEPAISAAGDKDVRSARYPFLRRLAAVGQPTQGVDTWDAFLARGHGAPGPLVTATAQRVLPSDPAALFFSSGSTSKPKGILSAHRGVSIQMWRFRRMNGFGPQDHIRCWSANGFFWSGNFAMSLGSTLAAGGSLVLQPTFSAAESLELMAAEKVNFPFAWPHQWAQLESAPN